MEPLKESVCGRCDRTYPAKKKQIPFFQDFKTLYTTYILNYILLSFILQGHGWYYSETWPSNRNLQFKASHRDKRTLPSNYLDMPKSNKYHDNLTVHSITQIGNFWI